MNNKIILLLLFFYSYSSFAQKPVRNINEARPLGFVMPDGVKKVTIPFEVYNNLIVIDVLLNRSLPLKFVLDTGVRTTVLTEKSLTDILNLPYSRKITIPGAGGKKLVDAYVVNNVSLNIGKIAGSGHALLVLETDLLQLKNYLGVNVHGILGYELFSRFVVDLNYDRKTVTFHNAETFKIKGRFVELPISVEDTKPYIEANFIIRGSEVIKGKFMMDTGASHTMMLDGRSSDKIYVPEPNISTTLGRGLAGDIFGEIARIDKMWVDKYVFEGVITTFPDADSYEISLDKNFRNGTFGGGMMSRFRIIFDYIHSKIYVRKGSDFHRAFEYNLSGLIIKAKGVYLREYEIDNVREHSAAEQAGVLMGDEIKRVNGTTTEDLTLEQVMGLLSYRANKTIRLKIIRDGQTLYIKYKLTRLI
jgi:predicted aspartyl protease